MDSIGLQLASWAGATLLGALLGVCWAAQSGRAGPYRGGSGTATRARGGSVRLTGGQQRLAEGSRRRFESIRWKYTAAPRCHATVHPSRLYPLCPYSFPTLLPIPRTPPEHSTSRTCRKIPESNGAICITSLPCKSNDFRDVSDCIHLKRLLRFAA